MLDYNQWGNQSTIMLSGEETGQESEQNRQVFDPYTTHNYSEATHFVNPETHFNFHQENPNSHTHFSNFYDPLAYTASASSYPYPHVQPVQPLGPVCQSGFAVLQPKSEPIGYGEYNNYSSRIGLNLGGRTYFASTEDDFVNRLYRRSRMLEPGSMNYPRCQAEGCTADLTHAKHYHRRHKVCEFHSKCSTVIAAGLTQRFCQQCSRFHVLTEFDNGKRSCRRRLADHNRRRRKSTQQSNNQENGDKSPHQLESSNAPNSSSENLPRSPSDSDPHPASVTVAISPPPNRFGHMSYTGGTTSSSNASTSSHFYSNGN